MGEELMTSYCREIAEEYQLPMPKMNSKYFAYASKSFDFALMAGVIAIIAAVFLWRRRTPMPGSPARVRQKLLPIHHP